MEKALFSLKYNLADFVRDEEGAALAELGLVTSLMIVLMPAFLELADIIAIRQRMAGALRAGEQYAMRYPDDEAGIESAIAANPVGDGTMDINSEQACECAGLTSLCGQSCSGGSWPSRYVNISVSYTVSDTYDFVPYAPETYTRQVSVRIE
jgi:Flp pilus assembly protein TadG